MSSYQASHLTATEAERIGRQPDGLREDEAPVLRFYETVKEDRVASEKQKRTIVLDVHMVSIHAPGDTKTAVPDIVKGWRIESTIVPVEKDKTVYQDIKQADGSYLREEKTVTEVVEEVYYEQVPTTPWFDKLAERRHHGQITDKYYEHCLAAYDAWVEKRAMPLDGTPVKSWNMLTSAQQTNLIELGLTTIERVATMTDDAMAAFGMGGRDVHNKAVAYLKTTDNNVASFEVKKLQDENERLEMRNKRQDEQMSAYEQKLAELEDRFAKSENTPKPRGRPKGSKNIDPPIDN
ncbi:hypothetical protein OAA60_00690 [Porticoccaceae bacterium]|nr:hypothetical protein [Porticoccaceae bacterium]